MIPSEYMEYFKSLVEWNPSAERWDDWWEAHKTEMATLVPRGIYLRLTSPMSYQKYMAVFAILEAAGYAYTRPLNYDHPKFREHQPIPASWLHKKISWAEFEKQPKGFSIIESTLAAIRPNFRAGDEVWTYHSRTHLNSGYAFVRDGVPYDHIVTLMS